MRKISVKYTVEAYDIKRTSLGLPYSVEKLVVLEVLVRTEKEAIEKAKSLVDREVYVVRSIKEVI